MIHLPVCMEKAKESGNPFFIELYELKLRDGIMRIAACDEDIKYNGNVYTAVPFQRGEIKQSIDNIIDSCEITLGDCDFKMIKYVLEGFDFRGCEAIIGRIQYPDSLSDANAVQLVFAGVLDEPSYTDGQFTVKIKSGLPEIDCPNRDFRLACNSDFGDAQCKMSLDKRSLQIVSASGNNITLQTTFNKDYWKDGVISVNGESRLIIASDSNMVTVNVSFLQSLSGQTAEIQRGCNKTADACKRYNNMRNFSGFPAIPFETTYR